MSRTPFEQLKDSCANYIKYPQNLVDQTQSPQRRDSYLDRLQDEESRLFDEKQAKLDVVVLKAYGLGKQDDTDRSLQHESATKPDWAPPVFRVWSDFVTTLSGVKQLFPVIPHDDKQNADIEIEPPISEPSFTHQPGDNVLEHRLL
jgi:hypothetical protein